MQVSHLVSGLTLGAAFAALAISAQVSAAVYSATVIASGLNNPRGLKFAADGSLYIAEAGYFSEGGPTTTVRGDTYHYGETGSITRYAGGVQQRVVTGLASLSSAVTGETLGAADIAFGTDGTGYVAIGLGTNPNARGADLAPGGLNLGRIFTFANDGTKSSFADVSAFEAANNPVGGPLDSNPYHLAALSDGLLVTDAGGNTLLRVGPGGTVSMVAGFPGRDIGGGFPSDSVPTGVAIGPDGNYYVSELTGFPFTQGSARINQVTPAGAVSMSWTGFTNISYIAFGTDGSLYVLELDSNGLATPGAGGALIRLGTDGSRETLFNTGLITPTGLEIGSDGAFYVTNFSAAAGIGQVVRIAAVPEPATWAGMIVGFGAIGGAMRRRAAAATTIERRRA
jgi:hypothetical protein